MVAKVIWTLSGLFYGSAALLFVIGGETLGSALFDWGFWALLGLGTVTATVGNALRVPPESADSGATA